MENKEGLYKNKHRIKSARWEGYDYSQAGFYFVTICTKNREMHFGNIINGMMILSEIGKIANQEWLNTEKIRDNINLDEFIVMPNHIHGIVVIQYKIDPPATETHAVETHAVETHCNASLQYNEYKNKFGPQSNNMSAIIRGFKGATTKIIRQKFLNINFEWQERFYDRVVRNENGLNKIRQYIIDNPIKWELDRNNPKNYN